MNEMLLLLASTFRVSTPLLLVSMGGLMSERSGVVNLALEGFMLVGAFTAAAVAHATHSPEIGALAAMGAGALLAALYALCVIEFYADQIVTGMAINLLAMGMTPFLCKILYDSTTVTPSLELSDRFGMGPLWGSWGLVLVIWVWLNRTPSGLWVRFAGEKPEALDAAGIRVKVVRWGAVLMGGALAAFGGAVLSTLLSSSFSRNMTAGRGFMALAALIFGRWQPVWTAVACVFFGFTDALQIRLQGVVLWGSEPVPVQFIQILPYVVTMLMLAGLVGRSRAPRALGIAFRK